MKRYTILALVVFALAAVPAALADDGTTPTRPAATETTTAPAAEQSTDSPGRPAAHLRQRLHMFVRHCVARTGAAPERCLARVKKILERLGKLDDRLQSRIGKIEERCGDSSTDERCKNAGKRVERLTRIDARVQKLRDRVQGWLDGKSASAGDEAGLDDAAGELGRLADG
jgi:hypothetical protein